MSLCTKYKKNKNSYNCIHILIIINDLKNVFKKRFAF